MAFPSVLQAKLKRPAFRRLLHRPAVTELLNRADQYPLTLLLAPAGYGKSAAIADWSSQSGYPVLFLNIDENDNDPSRFSLHLIASFAQAVPRETLPMPPSEEPGSLADTPLYYGLITAVEAYGQELFLVLENFDVLYNRKVLSGISYLLRNCPDNLHLIVASRGSPGLPLSTLRARDLILEIHKDTLQFSLEETRSLLNEVLQLEVSEVSIRAIHARTEGWMAGIRLLGTALERGEPLNEASGELRRGNDYIRDFLYEEVFSRLSSRVQDFLLATSILESFTEEAGRVLTEQEEVRETIDFLLTHDLFIEPMDGESGWYRYQTTFAEALREMLRRQSPKRYHLLHARAAEWFASRNMAQYAAAHAVEAGEYERAAELLSQCSTELLNRGELTSFVELVESLPESILRRHPPLAAEYGIVGAFTGSIQHDSTLEKIEAIIAAEPELDSWLPPLYQTVRTLRDGELDSFLSSAHETFERLPESALFYRALLSQALFSVQFFRSGDVAATRRSVERMLLNFPDSESPALYRSILLARMGQLYMLEGLLRTAHDYYLASANAAGAANEAAMPVIGLAYNGLAEIYREWDDLERAKEYAEEGLMLNLRWRTTEAMRSYLQLASLYYAANDIAQAEYHITKARSLLSNTVHASYEDLFLTMRYTELYLIAEDIDQLPTWKTDERSSPIICCYYHFRERTKIIDIHVHLSRGEYAEVLELTGELLPAAASRSRYRSCIELHLLRARALYGSLRTDEALEELSAALERAESEGFMRIFVDQGKRILPLIREAVKRELKPEYIKKILHRLTASGTEEDSGEEETPEEPYQLSPREIQVLALLAGGLTNREIADRLCISLRTVKWHTSNIFEKLGAKNRTEAVRIGQQENIISTN